MTMNRAQEIISLSIVESINEMATVGIDRQNNFAVQVNPDSGRLGLEYFKVYNSANISAAKKMARVEFRRPKYVYHKGKPQWDLNSKERKILVEFLKSSSNYPGLSNWQLAILLFNQEKHLTFDETRENLLSDKELKHPGHLPFDLPMPDYLQLGE